MRIKRISNSGFTMLEITVACFIVAMAVIPIFDMISGANKAMASIEDESVAFALATEAGEWFRSLSYSELMTAKQLDYLVPPEPQGASGVCFMENPLMSQELVSVAMDYEPPEQYSRFKRKTCVDLPVDTDGMPIRISVEVEWENIGSKGRDNKVMLEFMKFQFK
jgi:type II secretory pathway pseudopilin PulG